LNVLPGRRAATHGRVVGWKAGLTNPAMQQRFGVRPFLEADLLVEVGSAALHDARTPVEVLAALRRVIPFIELPDINLADPSKITRPAITWIRSPRGCRRSRARVRAWSTRACRGIRR